MVNPRDIDGNAVEEDGWVSVCVGEIASLICFNISVWLQVRLCFRVIIIIIIIITFKGVIRDLLQSPHSAANCLQHVRSSGPSANVCKSCATHRAFISCKCHVMCHSVRRDSSAVKFERELKSHLFELYFIGWTIKPMKEGRKPEYPEKTPGDELQKMPHTTARRFKPQTTLEPTQ